MLSKLFTPLKYINIRHPEKRLYDYVLPLLAAIVVTAVATLVLPQIKVVGDEGIIPLANGILQILSGFYIASLAAVSTFQRPSMDDTMEGTPPTYLGQSLTRRMFLSRLFGYLAFSSITIYFIGGAVELTHSSFSKLPADALVYLRAGFIFIYTFAVSNILFTTALGMHFMIEKINNK